MENEIKPDTTFANLQVLKSASDLVKLELKEKYYDTVKPFYDTIQMVMKANECDVFTAMLKIIGTTLYSVQNSFIFSAAVIEIVEENHFKEFLTKN